VGLENKCYDYCFYDNYKMCIIIIYTGYKEYIQIGTHNYILRYTLIQCVFKIIVENK